MSTEPEPSDPLAGQREARRDHALPRQTDTRTNAEVSHIHAARYPVGIVGAAYHLPGQRQDITAWGDEQDVSPELVETLLGVGCRYFHASENESDLDLLIAALERLAAQVGRSRIAAASYLVHVHTQNFSVPPAPTSLLAAVAECYALRPKLCFSVEQLACAGIVSAIDWASRLLAADPDAEHALVLTSDRMFGNGSHRVYQQGGIESDGASAVLLGKAGVACRIGPATYRNFTALHQGPATSYNQTAIARYSWLHTKRLFQDHGKATGIAVADHGQILPINACSAHWNLIARSLSIPPERLFLDNIRDRGHACCSDFAMNLVDRGFAILEQGQPVLYCGRSNVGAHAALTLLPAVTAAEQAVSRRAPVADAVTP